MILYARCFLLLISLVGYILYLQNKMKPEFAIGFAFSCIGCLMFFGGLLNILVITSVFIFCGGYICLFLVCKEGRLQGALQNFKCFGYLFFVIAGIYMAIILNEAKFCHYDDFSHWARAVKVLIKNNRFPNFSDLYFEFKSYPLGSAAFLYYFSLISGIRTEGALLFYQCMLLFGMAISLFALAKNALQKALTAAGVIILVSGNTLFTSLLVDTLLPVTAVFAIAFCVSCRATNNGNYKLLLPTILFLVSVKSSGIFYAAAIIVYAAISFRGKHFINKIGFLVFPTTFTLLIWKKHVEYSFYDGLSSKHSITAGKLLSMFGEKTSDDIQTILHKFYQECFSLKNPILIVIAVSIIIFLLAEKSEENKRTARKLLLFALISYMAYQIFLLAMYITSMPAYEAVVLASYERYHQSILLFVFTLAMISFLLCIGDISKKSLQAIFSVLLAAGLFIAVKPDLSNYRKQDISQFERNRFEGIDSFAVAPNAKCLVIAENNDSIGYIIQCSTYLFEPSDISFISEETLIPDPSKAEGYDYIIAVDSSEKLIEFENNEYGSFAQVLKLS